MEIKKAWEFFFRAYPSSQAFALPLRKDKQRKPAHAKETICPTPILHTHEKMGVQLVQGYNPLTQTLSVALPLCEEIKVAKFDYTDSNVRKRLSEPRHTWRGSFPVFVLNPPNLAGWLRSYSWCHPIGMSIGIQRCAHLCGAKVLINKVIAK